MTQEEKVLNWFRDHDTIDRRQAIEKLYIFNLPAVVNVMRRKGIQIETVDVRGVNSKYCKYRLARS